jgi:uncharacterized membrane protein YfcA
MSIFLPIAHLSINVLVVTGAGVIIGLLGGLFGVSGGFFLIPLLMFMGVRPLVAAASGSASYVASCAAGTLAHSRGGTVDFRMGFILFLGGAVGSTAGVGMLHWLNRMGPVNTVIRGLYVVMLGTVGSYMLYDAIHTWRRKAFLAERRFEPPRRRRWLERLPFHTRFRKSEVDVSLILPLGIGFLVGIVAAMMGVGGGFMLVPLMLYVLGMRMHVVAGTSLFQMLCTSSVITVLQAAENVSVDPVLSILIALGSTTGALVGTKIGRRLRSDELKILFALIVLVVGGMFLWDIVRTPDLLISHVVAR